jgi:organic radical activating enzyme
VTILSQPTRELWQLLERRNGKYQVQIRTNGSLPVSKAFTNKFLAEKWARKVQSEIEEGIYQDTRFAQSVTFEVASQRYIQEVLPNEEVIPERYPKVWHY